MQLDAITVEVKQPSPNSPTVTLVFKVNAKLQATDENKARWGLYVSILSVGIRWMTISGAPPGSRFPMPVNKTDTRFVGGSQTPTGLVQGDSWTPTFKGVYQRTDIAVPEKDRYTISAKLVPILGINESESRTTTLVVPL